MNPLLARPVLLAGDDGLVAATAVPDTLAVANAGQSRLTTGGSVRRPANSERGSRPASRLRPALRGTQGPRLPRSRCGRCLCSDRQRAPRQPVRVRPTHASDALRRCECSCSRASPDRTMPMATSESRRSSRPGHGETIAFTPAGLRRRRDRACAMPRTEQSRRAAASPGCDSRVDRGPGDRARGRPRVPRQAPRR
jgi:hypothetical protein